MVSTLPRRGRMRRSIASHTPVAPPFTIDVALAAGAFWARLGVKNLPTIRVPRGA